MKVLYAIQGTGNGHISRARDIIPQLQPHCHLDLMISGTKSEVQLPYPVKYKLHGFSFAYNQKGGIHYGKTVSENFSFRLLKEIQQFPIKDYDLIINDFEPVTAWAAKIRGVRCISMGHQASFLSEKCPRPEKRESFGEWVLKSYAPGDEAIGFHFLRYDSFIHTPVIREQIRNSQPVSKGHYTVYLPAVRDERLISLLGQIPQVEWQIFSKYARKTEKIRNILVRPVNNQDFVESFITCEGMLTGAGFESPAEALYMGKKLFCIPIKGQYEQQCNAAALRELGVHVIPKIDNFTLSYLTDWVCEGRSIQIDFPDQTEKIVAGIFEKKIAETTPIPLIHSPF
ncbi:MAG: glycosyltransferase family protein [Bacteroidia bacterium]